MTPYRSPGGREFVLVTVSGALGLAPDDPNTPEREAGGQALSNAAIDVIDAAERRIVATIPLGLAAPSFERLAIDPTGRVAMVGSAIGRKLFAVDLAPLDSISLPPGARAAGARRLDGTRRGDLRRRVAARAAGARERRAGGDLSRLRRRRRLRCDGHEGRSRATSATARSRIVGVDLSGNPPVPVPAVATRFAVQPSMRDHGAAHDGVARALARAGGRARAPGPSGRRLQRTGRALPRLASGGPAVRRSHRLALSALVALAALLAAGSLASGRVG